MIKRAYFALSGASLICIAASAHAQDTIQTESIASGLDGDSAIIVSARRRDERLQDVPQTVNVVTAAEIEKLNLRDFREIQNVVAGLTLDSTSSFSQRATVRGVQFTPEANGTNATVEFYLNEAPITSGFVFNSMFDIGQFELLRGPQGTLRGRASPSGSITVATRRPNLHEAGVTGSVTVTNTHARTIDGALNVPIIKDVLGIRLAGKIDRDRGNSVRSIYEDVSPRYYPKPKSEFEGIRASVRFEPTDWVALNLMYQGVETRNSGYAQVVSPQFVPNPAAGLPTEALVIKPFDRLAIGNRTGGGQDQKAYIGNLDVRFAGQKLSVLASRTRQTLYSMGGSDPADFFGPPRFPAADRNVLDPVVTIGGVPTPQAPACAENMREVGIPFTNQDFYQCTFSRGKRRSYEVRLASEDRVAGIFDYVAGYLNDKNNNPTRLTTETPVVQILNPSLPNAGSVPGNAVLSTISLRATIRDSRTKEESFFGNVIAHLTDRFEISGGARHIKYSEDSALIIPGAINSPRDMQWSSWIYNASAKYRFNENLMVYATFGTSWRPGAFAVGIFSVSQSPLLRQFQETEPEKSKSYEIGLRSSFLDQRGRFNVSIYKQDFTNYVYRSPTGVVYLNNQTATRAVPATFNLISGVPAEVKGAEAEASFQIMPQWSISGNIAYADGKIRDATIPCTDLDRNNIPDVNPVTPPNAAALIPLLPPGEHVAACTGFSGPLLNDPKWNASLRSEAGFSFGPKVDGFVRGLVNYRPKDKNDLNNTNDDVSGYALINLYAGVRAPDGAWELTAFAKNVLNTQKILARGGSNISQNVSVGNSSFRFDRGYYTIGVTAPREIGVAFRAALGSR